MRELDLRTRWMVVVLLIAGFLGSLSQSLLTSALPAILESFQITAALGQWLTTVYLLVLGVITAVSAYAFGRFSTRRLIQISLGTFLAGCVLAFFAVGFPMLFCARVVQALGGGFLIPIQQIVVMHLFPPDRQGEALGLTGIIVGFAPTVGPVLSGVLVDTVGWRGIFLLLIVISAATLAAGHFVIRDVGEREQQPLDVWSILLYGAGFTTFMIAVTRMRNGGMPDAGAAILFLCGAVCLWAFVRRQRHSTAPLLRLALLRHRTLLVGTVLLCLFYILMLSGNLLVPLYVQSVCGRSATVSGLILLPGSLLIACLSQPAGKWMDRHGARRLLIAGMALLGAGSGVFACFSTDTAVWIVTAAYAARGLGMAILTTTTAAYGVGSLPLADKAHGSAIMQSLRQMTGSLFSTVLVILATAVSGSGGLDMRGIRVAFLVMLGIAAAGLFLAVWQVPSEKRTA